jgi:hypothetical protein
MKTRRAEVEKPKALNGIWTSALRASCTARERSGARHLTEATAAGRQMPAAVAGARTPEAVAEAACPTQVAVAACPTREEAAAVVSPMQAVAAVPTADPLEASASTFISRDKVAAAWNQFRLGSRAPVSAARPFRKARSS